MSLIRLMSPKGGTKLNWLGWLDKKPQTITFHSRETGEPVVLEDHDDAYALIIGYSDKHLEKGERMYMKYSECRELFKLLKKEFER